MNTTPPTNRMNKRKHTALTKLACVSAALAVATLLGACSKDGAEPTDFDAFIDRHRCEKLTKGADGDIDMTCLDPQTGQRVPLEFEANDRPKQYFTDTAFGGIVQVFAHDSPRR